MIAPASAPARNEKTTLRRKDEGAGRYVSRRREARPVLESRTRSKASQSPKERDLRKSQWREGTVLYVPSQYSLRQNMRNG